MEKQTFLTGFMLFALFFGAGNLIYPPTLGIEAGTSYWTALIGFILTGVGLPILAIAAVAIVSNDEIEIGNQVHPKFGLIFSSIIYLAIGPFFGIPRAANVAFEMGVLPLTNQLKPSLLLFGFTIVFFLIVFWLSLNPSKLVERIGQWLTPALVLAIAALSIGGIILLDADVTAPTTNYESSPFFTGFIQGYLTMDAIAALAFGIIVVTALKGQGITSKKRLVVSTIKSGLISGIALAVVYGAIGWIGTQMAMKGSFKNGGQILSTAAELMYGEYGKLLLGIIVLLACLTTSVGLTVACGQFFSTKTRLRYRSVVGVISIISFFIANLGLNQIISFSIPVLVTIYPIAIVLIVLTFLNASTTVYRLVILFTAFISMLDGLGAFGLSFATENAFVEGLPFYSLGLGWLIPAIIGAVLGFLYDMIITKRTA